MKILPIAVATMMLLAGCTIKSFGLEDNLLPNPSPDSPGSPLWPSPSPTSAPGAGPILTNTEVVLNYVTTRRSTVVSQFLNAEEAIKRAAAAKGGLFSGATQKTISEAYVKTVQSFLNDSISYANTMNSSRPVDKEALKTSLNAYRSQDISYIKGHFGASSPVLQTTIASINSAYDLALFFPF